MGRRKAGATDGFLSAANGLEDLASRRDITVNVARLATKQRAFPQNWVAITMSGYEVGEARRSSGLLWFWVPLVLVLFVGGAFSIAAYTHEPSLTPVEALAVGYGGLAALIVGLFGAAIGVIIGLFGALIGLVAAGGALAFTFFLLASPVIAIIFMVLFFRRPKAQCAEHAAHGQL